MCALVSVVIFASCLNVFISNQHCDGPELPWSRVVSLPGNEVLKELETNREVGELLRRTALPYSKYLTLSLPGSDDCVAHLRLLLPPGFQESDKIGFPALLHLDGRPGGQSVTRAWRVDWETYMASKLGYVIIYLDVAGSGYSGETCRKSVDGQLGLRETRDIIHVLRVVGRYPFIDERKIGVVGRGYGGYLTVRLLAQSRLARCGVGVAPITVWQQHNPLYTQRYLGEISINTWEHYSQADLTRHVNTLISFSMSLWTVAPVTDCLKR